jgi:ABC-type transporter Mla subunit MlaD
MNETETTSRSTERVVGVFVVFALLLLLAGFAYYLYHTAERKGWRVPRCPYYTFVQSADGLEVGDPVRMMGFDIGELTVIEPQPPSSYYHVFIGLEIKRPYYGYIWTDSKLKVTTAGLLGRRQLEIIKGETGGPTVFEEHNRISEVLIDGKPLAFAKAPKGPFLPPDESPSVTERAEKILGQAEAALPNILAVTNRLNAVLDNSAALTSNANQLVSEVRPAVSNLNMRLDATLVAADTNLVAVAGNLNDTILNLAAITSNLNSQVQSNDQMLSSISKLVIDTDNLVQGLKKQWLLRGVFQKMNSGTNAPPPNVRFKPKTENKN